MWIYRLPFVCFCVRLFVRLRISSPRMNLAASNFARWFMGVLGRESPILGNFAPQKPKNGLIRHHREVLPWVYILTPHCKRHATDAPFVENHSTCGCRSACVDIRLSPKTYLLLLLLLLLSRVAVIVAYRYTRNAVVSLSVCLSVCHLHEPCTNG